MITVLRTAALICTFLWATVPVAWAVADFERGFVAYKAGDYATALKEWRPLAERGLAKAQHNLGVMYENGRGVPQDYAEARRWYQKAADQGQPYAQNNLGQMFERVLGVKQDLVQAQMWYILSAAQGNAPAAQNRDALAKKMPPAQLAEAQKRARAWKPKK